MHQSGWIEIIRTIPTEMHTGLAVLMQNGAEINIQTVVRMEEQFLVVRGRTAGSMDGGLTFFLPYDQISTLICYKPVKEDVVNGWFNREPFHSLDGSLAPTGAEAPREPGVVAESGEPLPGPVAAPPVGPAPAKPAPAPGSQPAPVVPTISARPAPGPQAAAAQMTMNNMGVLPAKAAMIERLRKKAQGAPPGAAPKPPEQK